MERKRMKKLSLLFWAIFSLFYNISVFGEANRGNLKPSAEKTPMVLKISPLWLMDLERSYEIGFSHQFGHLKYRDNLTVPNHNIPRDAQNVCQNVSFLSFNQNWRLIHTFGYASLLNSTTHEMLDNPRAKLFQFQDHWGEFEDYRFSRSKRYGLCTHLIHLSRRVKSVVTFGKCIRLFEHPDCRGWSLAVYPGSSNSFRQELPRHVTLKSIGPCFENEFLGGFLNQSLPGFVAKNPEIRTFQPDLVMMFNPDINLGTTKLFAGLWVKYLLGPRNRTEIIETILASASGKQGPTSNVLRLNFEKSLEKEDGDVLGYALPTTIGGPANEAFNIFPANESALKKWENVLRHHTRNYTEFVILHLQFEYESKNQTRPLFFYYRIFVLQLDNKFLVQYGQIINGHRTNLRRERLYIQSIPKFEYKGTQNINLTEVLDRRRASKKIHYFFSSTSIHNINRAVDIGVTSRPSCKNTGLMNGIKLKETVSDSSLLNAQIEGMIKNPMVRLFSGENLTGEFQDFHSGKNRKLAETYKGCSNVDDLTIVNSAETFGTCIRLFKGTDCKNMSLAIYGGMNNLHGRRIKRILTEVKSVGPCLEDEFTRATFIDRIPGNVVKDLKSSFYFPDKVQFGGFIWDNVLSFERSGGLRNIYHGLGPKNRIEYIQTWFDQKGPARIPNPVNVEETEFYKSLDKKEGDVPCYAIPLEFYGPANEPFNIFPISQFKVDDWRRIFPSISDSNQNLFFYTELHFVYESDISSRPQFIYYHFSIAIKDKIYYGRFNNL